MQIVKLKKKKKNVKRDFGQIKKERKNNKARIWWI